MCDMKAYVSIFMNVKFHDKCELGRTYVTLKARENAKSRDTKGQNWETKSTWYVNCEDYERDL